MGSYLAAEPKIFDYLGGWPGWVVAAVVVLLATKQVVDNAAVWLRGLGRLFGWLSPTLYTKAGRSRRQSRQRVAKLLQQHLARLESDLDWDPGSFTELSSTIEAVDTPLRLRSVLLGKRRATGTYHTRSLMKALAHETNLLVRLEGVAGSGKSVAMRQYARRILEDAASRRFRLAPLALYVSLREFTAEPGEPLAQRLQEYLFQQINPGGGAVLAGYLEREFPGDLANGDIIILLDSFDEIPAILGSNRVDRIVGAYVEAITDMMGGSSSRCVVAAREYKGPQVPGWTRLSLVGMQIEQQLALLRKHGLHPTQINAIVPLLQDPRAGFSADLRNPLYLSLLAQYMVNNDSPPSRPSEMFSDYVSRQLGRPLVVDDADVPVLTSALQVFAFNLTCSATTGLSGDAAMLRAAVAACAQQPEDVDRLIDGVLESGLVLRTLRGSRVAVVHRRVQEYLATRYVTEHPDAVSPHDLAFDGRWRETAVALLQVGIGTDVLLAEIETWLAAEAARIAEEPYGGFTEFSWSPEAIHVLELLVSAYTNTSTGPPEAVRDHVGVIVGKAMKSRYLSDRKFCLDCIPIVPVAQQEELVVGAFAGSSNWLRRAALRDCASLNPLPDSIDLAIRRFLISLLAYGQLAQAGAALDGDLRRIYGKTELIRTRRLLRATPTVVVALCGLTIALDTVLGKVADIYDLRTELLYSAVFPIGFFWLFQSSDPISYPRRSPIQRFFSRVFRLFGFRSEWLESRTIGYSLILIVASLIFWTMLYLMYGGMLFGSWLDLSFLAYVLLFAYSLAWGPAVLTAVNRNLFSRRLRWWEMAVPLVAIWPIVWAAVRFAGLRIVGHVLWGMLRFVLWTATLLGMFYLLERFAGTAGRFIVIGIKVLLFAVAPAMIIVAVAREVVARVRLRRRIRRADVSTPASFLSALAATAGPIEAADFIRLVRTRRTSEVRGLPRQFVREFAAAIESSGQEEAGDVDADIAAALESKVLTRAMLRQWHGDVLDELGQLDEYLRER